MSKYYDEKFVKTKYLRKYNYNPKINFNKIKHLNILKDSLHLIIKVLIVNLKSY